MLYNYYNYKLISIKHTLLMIQFQTISSKINIYNIIFIKIFYFCSLPDCDPNLWDDYFVLMQQPLIKSATDLLFWYNFE